MHARPALFLTLAILVVASACNAPEPAKQLAAPKVEAQPLTEPPAPVPAKTPSLREARKGFVTRIVAPAASGGPVPEPPPEIFKLVHYDAAVGRLAAYVSPDPKDGERHPAVLWLTGGDSNSIDVLWEPAPRSNDQTAAAFRRAGIVLMFPSLRGGNDNPGVKEAFLGEVDDILAAADYLGRLPYVDPQRIYLGGHSTGGTLALLVAESSDRFRATFAFGPVDEIAGYGAELLPFDLSDPRELRLRSPVHWLASVRTPTFVFEGRDPPSNIDALLTLEEASDNPMLKFLGVAGADHFSILAPATEVIATRILLDVGPESNIAFAPAELGGRP